MIEKRYGKYVRNDVDEQLARILGSKSATLSETLEVDKGKGGADWRKSGEDAALAERRDWWRQRYSVKNSLHPYIPAIVDDRKPMWRGNYISLLTY